MRERYAFIIPANKRETVNKALEDLGMGPDSFSVPIVGDKDDTSSVAAKFYGCSWDIDSECLAKLSDVSKDVKSHKDKSFSDVLKAEKLQVKDIKAEAIKDGSNSTENR